MTSLTRRVWEHLIRLNGNTIQPESLGTVQTRIDELERRLNSIQNTLPQLVDFTQNEESLRSLLCLFNQVEVCNSIYHHYGVPLDGGYRILDLSEPLTQVISFGIGYDSSFEDELATEGVQVDCYDHTIDVYPGTSNVNIRFMRLGLSDIEKFNPKNFSSIEMALQSIKSKRIPGASASLLLKMDCEGAEWGALNLVTSTTLDQFDQILVEFHNLKDVVKYQLYTDVLSKIALNFWCIEIHPNNHAETLFGKNLLVTDAIEVLFLNRRLINSKDTQKVTLGSPLPNAPFRLSIHPRVIY